MKNPYEVLEISPNATDDEVKTAYRKMAKKYHPDNYADSPLADLAEQKMKEINEAYDAILEQRKNGGSGNTNSYYNSNANSSFANVRSYINMGRITEADAILEQTSVGDRNAEWYFLKGIIFNRLGRNAQAYSFFQEAIKMDPSNQEYNQAYNNMNIYSNNYGGYNTSGIGRSNCDCWDICTAIWCADCLCDCLGSGC